MISRSIIFELHNLEKEDIKELIARAVSDPVRGMGSYHGKTGFDTFTHYKSIVDKKTWIDLTIRYRPYHNWKRKLLCLFLK